ncbi:juvenile hormone esterase-like [Episyrphus balteatus]|uniref:juvenile hormone esterase-like n=1 Tax=Episyrphus balteatus TaxID=286459 RepID=UPI00248656C8|nr:juvenile hormone esterase-like [Episyrphus balteatus]
MNLKVLLLLYFVSFVENGPIVGTSLGKIHGSIMKTVTNRKIKAFRGIPYAEPPIGKNRFEAPIAKSGWSDSLRDATIDGFICPQLGTPKELLSEDCLVLNVYTKNLKGNKSVIFYIHGGGNEDGTGHSLYTGPQYLMDHDIVLVTFNYRLGALGFLSTGTNQTSDNNGYLDQVMALQWVHDHISNFGGNPKSVTLLGMSSGAVSTIYHMASPLSKGLFHRVIAMSGSGTHRFPRNNLFWTRKLAKSTSCPMYNSKDLIECLRKVSWERINEVAESWQTYGFIDIKWTYDIDGHFLLDTPVNIFAEGKFNKVPLMTGITKDEFTNTVFHQKNNIELLDDISMNFDKYAPDMFLYEPDAEKSRKIQEFYLKNQTISNQSLENFGRIFADCIVGHAVHRLLELTRKHQDVFFYRFDHLGLYSVGVDGDGKPIGLVCHADDLQYIFPGIKLGAQNAPEHTEMWMVERISGLFSSFAKNGAPDDIFRLKWLPSNSTHVHTMYIGRNVTLGPAPYTDRFQLWDTLFPV